MYRCFKKILKAEQKIFSQKKFKNFLMNIKIYLAAMRGQALKFLIL